MSKKYDEKILLIDDDSKNLQVAMNILKDYNVIFAQSGERALELIKENNFDLILLDIVMPTMNGYDVCKKIKEDEKNKNIPVIFLTVKDEEKDIVKGFELGAVDYIIKPFFSDVLLQRVNTQLKLRNTMKKLENVNNNLNNIVDEQILQIRKKDEIINKQERISAINNVIDLISIQWKTPLDKLKLYLQSLNLEYSYNENNIFNSAMEELEKLDKIMNDFHKFFEYKKSKENINIKVVIDNALINLKDKLSENNLEVKVDGDILLTLDIVMDELYHIFLNLLEFSISNNVNLDKKNINIFVEQKDNSIFISYEDNIKSFSKNEVSNLFEVYDDSAKTFNLAFYLIKIFIEKNKGSILINSTENGIKYLIKFDK